MRRNALMQLLAQNRQPYQPMQSRIVRAAAADEATIYLYDPIVGDRMTAEWYGAICPQDFVPELAALDVSTIHLRINCPGGDVFAAEAMCQSMREHRATIVGHIDGVAASAATAIACSCDEVVAARNAKYMIHQAWCMAYGNADDLRQVVELLDKVDGDIVAEYMRFTGSDQQQIADWVKAETWFTAEEALAAKFVHRIDTSGTGDAAPKQMTRSWNLKAYGKAPAEPPAAPPEPPMAPADHRARQSQRLRLLQACSRIE